MSLKKISGALLILLFIILFGGIVYSYIENWSLLDGIYFSAVTISTLGYGDLVPKTDLGKIFTIIYSLSGIAIGLYILTVMGRSFFSFELGRGHIKRVIIIKKDNEFDVTKLLIGEIIEWHPGGKETLNGNIIEIGLNYIKVHITSKNNQLVPKKEQKILTITSKGKIQKI